MEGHIRDLQTFLRDYGATDFVVEGGRKHQKLRFVFKGKDYWFPVPHSSSGDPRANRNNETTLRRLLGPPVMVEKSRHTLEEMMRELNDKTELTVLNTTLSPLPSPVISSDQGKSWQGTVAAYKVRSVPVGCQVYIVMPTEAVTGISAFNITRLDEENWKLSPGGRKRWQKIHTSTMMQKCLYVDPNLAPFGSSPAEMVRVDGAVLIHQALKDRKTLATTAVLAVPAVKHHLRVTEIENRVTEIETQMREIIKQVQVIEVLGPYRLVRLRSNRLVWRAPTIETDGSGYGSG